MKKRIKIIVGIFVLFFLGFYIYLYTHQTTPILMYHSFDKTKINNYAAVSIEKFYHQMEFIKNGKYNAVSLSDYCKLLKENKPIPRNLVVITIDDGYKDNLPAFKILKQLNLPATVFLTTEKIGTPGFLSREEIIVALDNSKISIGSHTNTHSELSKIPESIIKNELAGSRSALEKMFSQQIETLAYPSGAFNENVLAIAKESSFVCACATNRGFSQNINRFALRRIKVTEKDNDFTFWAKLSGYYNIFKKVKKPY